MTTITNQNCKSLLLTSDVTNDIGNNPDNYMKAVLTLKKNCCGTLYEDAKSDFSSIPAFSVSISNATIKLGKLTIQNVITNLTYTITLPNTVITSCSTISDIVTFINNYMTEAFGESETFVSECNIISGNIVFSLQSETGNFIPLTITYYNDSIPLQTVNFSGSTFYFTNGSLIILPTIVNEIENFSDSVYSVNIVYTLSTGTTIIDSSCVFVDCKTKCDVAAAMKHTKGQETIDLLMYHYGLTFANNCNCDCTYLCDLYKELRKKLDTILKTTNTTINGCGCS
jgi:hypothetical protein